MRRGSGESYACYLWRRKYLIFFNFLIWEPDHFFFFIAKLLKFVSNFLEANEQQQTVGVIFCRWGKSCRQKKRNYRIKILIKESIQGWNYRGNKVAESTLDRIYWLVCYFMLIISSNWQAFNSTSRTICNITVLSCIAYYQKDIFKRYGSFGLLDRFTFL